MLSLLAEFGGLTNFHAVGGIGDRVANPGKADAEFRKRVDRQSEASCNHQALAMHSSLRRGSGQRGLVRSFPLIGSKYGNAVLRARLGRHDRSGKEMLDRVFAKRVCRGSAGTKRQNSRKAAFAQGFDGGNEHDGLSRFRTNCHII